MNKKQKILDAREKKNKGLLHASLEMETSTHLPMLIKALENSAGPVLEIGSGLFSTPFLHWLCHPTERSLITLEQYEHYAEFARKFRTRWHEICITSPRERVDYDLDINGRYGVVFIDHSPKKPRTRGDDALLFKDSACYIVLHDAGPTPNPKYGYEPIYQHFKYVKHWNDVYPSTTVLSNFDDPNLWN